MTRNCFLFFFIALLLFSINCSVGSNNSNIEANLLYSKLVNYKNKIYRNEPAWIEYQIELINNNKYALNLCDNNEAYLIIKSKQGKLNDTLFVAWGKNILLPQEKDTIRVIDLFIEKQKEVSEFFWVDPDVMIFYCGSSSIKNSFPDSIIQTNLFKIKKKSNFVFKIE